MQTDGCEKCPMTMACEMKSDVRTYAVGRRENGKFKDSGKRVDMCPQQKSDWLLQQRSVATGAAIVEAKTARYLIEYGSRRAIRLKREERAGGVFKVKKGGLTRIG